MFTCGHLFKGNDGQSFENHDKSNGSESRAGEGDGNNRVFLLVVFFPSTWTPSLVSRDK